MMTWPAILSFMFPPPPTAYVTVATAMAILGSANAGLSEVRGANMKYSKFTNVDSPSPAPGKDTARVSSRTGMLVVYTPAFLAAAAGFMWIPSTTGGGSLRLSLLTAALAIHFLKRVFEVLFVHKFSGFMGSSSMCIISLSYFLFTVNSIYVQYLSRDLPMPSIDLMYPGLLLFLIGIVGNFYHHIILSRLRNEGGVKEYKIPQGGLFGLVTCPHYLFEVIDFVGLAFISQTAYSFASALGTIAYLMGRSYATRRWYVSKFEDYPRRIKAIFPFIF